MRAFTTIVALHVEGHAIKTKADHPFLTDKGWVEAGDLRAGDLLRSHDGSWASVQAVEVEERPVHLAPGFMPYPATELLSAGTLIPTADGLKPIEDIKVGDYIAVPSPDRN
jgi:intein/homing endonuclease